MSRFTLSERKELLKQHILMIRHMLRNLSSDENDEKWEILKKTVQPEKM